METVKDAPWIGLHKDDYYGYISEEEQDVKDQAYSDYIDRLMEEDEEEWQNEQRS
jgi:hypothetical protein